MKINKILLGCLLGCTVLLSSCYKEVNPNDGNFETIGDVPLISTLVPSTTAPTAGQKIDLRVQLSFVNTTIKTLKLYQRIGTTGAYSFLRDVPFSPNLDPVERVHILTIPYDVPNEKGKAFSLQLEAITDKDLVSFRRTMNPTNVTIR